MTSDRHKPYLDAARDAILDLGWKRTTLTEVARRAGVSRMTIYRAWPDMQTLLADLMTREWAGVFAGTPVPTDGEVTAESLAEGITSAVVSLRANPLFRRILDLDPELLLPYLLERRGRSQQGVLDLLTPLVAAGQAAGTIRPGDPELLARTVLLAAHGVTLSAHTMADDEITEQDLADQLSVLIAQGLAR